MATQYGEDIAVLKDQMKDVKTALDRIEGKLDSSAAVYATKQELRTFKWMTVPLVIILTAVLTALVYYYLSHGKFISPETTITNTSNPPASSSTTNNSTTNNTTTPSNSGGLLQSPLQKAGL